MSQGLPRPDEKPLVSSPSRSLFAPIQTPVQTAAATGSDIVILCFTLGRSAIRAYQA